MSATLIYFVIAQTQEDKRRCHTLECSFKSSKQVSCFIVHICIISNKKPTYYIVELNTTVNDEDENKILIFYVFPTYFSGED